MSEDQYGRLFSGFFYLLLMFNKPVSKSKASFCVFRLSLPEEWRGLRDDELSQKSGIDQCIFVHAGGFIGGNHTYEGIIQMARIALQKKWFWKQINAMKLCKRLVYIILTRWQQCSTLLILHPEYLNWSLIHSKQVHIELYNNQTVIEFIWLWIVERLNHVNYNIKSCKLMNKKNLSVFPVYVIKKKHFKFYSLV